MRTRRIGQADMEPWSRGDAGGHGGSSPWGGGAQARRQEVVFELPVTSGARELAPCCQWRLAAGKRPHRDLGARDVGGSGKKTT